MSNKKSSKRKKSSKLILSFCAILLIVIIVFVVTIVIKNIKNDQESDEQNTSSTVEADNETLVDENEEIVVEENKETIDEKSNDSIQDETAFYEIETKYCKLYFTETWKEQIEVRYSEEAGYKAEFYGLVEGKDAQHLFDVCFNSDDGDLLGYLDNEGEIVNISIDVMELEMDKSWTQEELDQLYSMQEEMNYVMNSLSRNENYVEP